MELSEYTEYIDIISIDTQNTFLKEMIRISKYKWTGKRTIYSKLFRKK